ncbi:hypothetical protein SO802_012934 [Lithocarpus litseifolius]|uniref:Uncharacterized protein n=1 Tax=Lithocarpus litseifolius TaxID=425828 RepID=A0AAW2D459_9ROSI
MEGSSESKGESMDRLLLHCDVAHALWVNMFQIFEVQWVMLGSIRHEKYEAGDGKGSGLFNWFTGGSETVQAL